MDHYKTTPKLTGTTVGGGSERHSGLSVIYKTTAIGNNALALGASYGYKKFREEDQYLGRGPFVSNCSGKYVVARIQFIYRGQMDYQRAALCDEWPAVR